MLFWPHVVLLLQLRSFSSGWLIPPHWRRQWGPRGPGPPIAGRKFFFVKIEGLLEPVVLNLSFRVRSNAMFTSERRHQCYRYQNIKNRPNLKLSPTFSTKLVKNLKAFTVSRASNDPQQLSLAPGLPPAKSGRASYDNPTGRGIFIRCPTRIYLYSLFN